MSSSSFGKSMKYYYRFVFLISLIFTAFCIIVYCFNVGRCRLTPTPNDSSSQLLEYFPNQIECARIFAGDDNYMQTVTLQRPKLEEDNLDMGCEAIQSRFAAAPSRDEPYSIAYAKTVYKARTISFSSNRCGTPTRRPTGTATQLMPRSPEIFHRKIAQLANCLPNVLVSNVSRTIGRPGTNQNYAHTDCMRTLESKNFEYIFMLQNHDILTRTHSEFAKILSVLEGSTIVEKKRCPSSRCKAGFPTTLDQFGLCPKSLSAAEMSICKAANITYMKGGMQALLPKAASDFIVNEINTTTFIEFFNNQYAGDEQMFATLTTNEALKIPGRYTANCGFPMFPLRHVVWYDQSKCQSGNMRHNICVFGLEDLPNLMRVPQFLINKMLPSFDNGVIQCHSELLLKRNIGIVPSYDHIDSFANGDHARFQRELRKPGFDPAKFVCDLHATMQ